VRLVAINVLLDPDAATVAVAQAWNARLREQEPLGFALDADHSPHITLVQAFVRAADLDTVAGILRDGLSVAPPPPCPSHATGLYHLSDGTRGLMGLVIAPTDALRALQERLLSTLVPFTMPEGSSEAFAPRADGQPVSSPTLAYVREYAATRTGAAYHPHLTLGIGPLELVSRLEAEPFAPFPVRPVSISLYQLGEYGVAQRKLHHLHTYQEP
jgi:hypothetical protein